MCNSLTRITLFLFICLYTFPVFAQQPKRYDAVDIYQKLEKLNVLGNVLYIAAHPDDENTRLITYFSKKDKLNTAYVSLTRGDGGQNSVGPEQSELLGLIRTQELLAARRVDGGQQFFTRAMDFGYSKSAEETLNIWNREDLLYDMVWVIRNFKPDIMVTRFPADRRAGHGQHEASAIIAEEAFDKAADPNVFPDQLEFVDPWQPKRLFQNTGRWWYPDIQESDSIKSVDIGEYEAMTGLSYSELGADSRSQHKSQAFGVTWRRGESKEYLKVIKGDLVQNSVFDGIDLTWARAGREDIGRQVDKIKEEYDFVNPSNSIPDLLDLRNSIMKVEDEFWKNKKLSEVDQIIKDCLGLYLEVNAEDYYVSYGDVIDFSFEITNRSDIDVTVKAISSKELKSDTTLSNILGYNDKLEFKFKREIISSIEDSNPYWLRNPRIGYEYDIKGLTERGKPKNDPPITFDISLDILGQEISYSVPVVYTWTNRLDGQQYRPFEVGPSVFTEIMEKVIIFPDQEPKEITAMVYSANGAISGTLKLDLPKGWRSEPESHSFDLEAKEGSFKFKLFPSKSQESVSVIAVAEVNGQKYNKTQERVSYDHIPTQVTFLPAEAKAVKIDLKKSGKSIAYIEGAGDDVAESLSQIGYDVTMVNEFNIDQIVFSEFDAVVVGIMAYTNFTYLADYNDQLLQYVEMGGNLILQYNNIRIGLRSPITMPYPIEFSPRSSRVRVSVEDAEVRFLAPSHPVLNTPNKISEDDFDGWVQERGLYFPVSWDSNYTAVLSSNDPGEDPLDGGLLVAQYGKGYYVYSSYAWFRQLPAGVSGAYRIFSNLISLGQTQTEN